MMVVVMVVMMGVRVLLAYPLAAPALLFCGRVQRPPLLLVPCAEALASKHEVVVFYYDGLHPAVVGGLGFLCVGFPQVR